MTTKTKFKIIIEELSEGDETAWCATFPELNDSIAMGDNFRELTKSIRITLEEAKKDKIGIFAPKQKKKSQKVKA